MNASKIIDKYLEEANKRTELYYKHPDIVDWLQKLSNTSAKIKTLKNEIVNLKREMDFYDAKVKDLRSTFPKPLPKWKVDFYKRIKKAHSEGKHVIICDFTDKEFNKDGIFTTDDNTGLLDRLRNTDLLRAETFYAEVADGFQYLRYEIQVEYDNVKDLKDLIMDEMTDEEQEKYIVEVFGLHEYYQWLNHFIDISECNDQMPEYILPRKLFFAQSIA